MQKVSPIWESLCEPEILIVTMAEYVYPDRTMQMVERLLEQVQAIKRVFAQDEGCRPLRQLTWQD